MGADINCASSVFVVKCADLWTLRKSVKWGFPRDHHAQGKRCVWSVRRTDRGFPIRKRGQFAGTVSGLRLHTAAVLKKLLFVEFRPGVKEHAELPGNFLSFNFVNTDICHINRSFLEPSIFKSVKEP